jgi:ubiquinone/menaquinone biosynthesis C-methylase UbiE
VPAYLKEVDIHCMPGNYHAQYGPADATQGAVFDRGAFIYGLGGVGELHDGVGKAMLEALRERYTDIDPRRVVDLGCTIGHNTLPLCDAFPDAEIHAVDAAEPMLRYAHGRAKSLKKAVHWHQADVRSTGFPDGHFDLVVSSILFHEVQPDQIPAVFAECHRILAPGGVMAHVDIPDYFKSPDPLFVALVDADHFHNNEPFWGSYHQMDLEAMMVDAGFPADSVFRGVAPLDGFPWSFFGARKESASSGAGV